jgi:hypothetical protein
MPGSHRYSRRHLMQSGAITAAAAAVPRWLRAMEQPTPKLSPFSKFTNVVYVYGLQGRSHTLWNRWAAAAPSSTYDNDGWMDIFILGGRTLEGTPANSGNRLYHNNRDGTFTDVTAKAGLADPGWAVGVCVGDYNNDGFEDLFLTYYGHNRLYHNNGNGTFTDVTARGRTAA